MAFLEMDVKIFKPNCIFKDNYSEIIKGFFRIKRIQSQIFDFMNHGVPSINFETGI